MLRLQQERIEAFSEFRRDVLNGDFPAENELVVMPEEEWHKFQEALAQGS